MISAITLFFSGIASPVRADGPWPLDITSQGLQSLGIYDYISAEESGRSIGQMILDIEGAPERAYEVLESAIYTSAYAISPRDDEMTALRKVDAILFEHMRFQRGLPGTTFSEALTSGVLDCSDASIIFVSAAERVGRYWQSVLLPFHMFVAARQGAGYILWETMESRTFDIDELIEFHGLRQELIDAGVYLTAMDVQQHIAEVYRNLGGIQVRGGDLENAIANLNISLYLRPGHPPALIWRGYAYALGGEYGKAEKDYLDALSIDQYDWVANYHLSATYSNLGLSDLAEYYLGLAQDFRPANSQWVLEEALPYLSGE